jgi:hypothetical protein
MLETHPSPADAEPAVDEPEVAGAWLDPGSAA